MERVALGLALVATLTAAVSYGVSRMLRAAPIAARLEARRKRLARDLLADLSRKRA